MALNQSWINVFEIISRRRAQWYSLFGTSCITSACSIASSKRNSVTWHDVLGSLPFNILSRCATVGYVGLQSLNSLPQASIMYNKNKTYSHLSITIFSLYNFDVSSLIFFSPITPPIHFLSPFSKQQKSTKRIFLKLLLEKFVFLFLIVIIHDPFILHASFVAIVLNQRFKTLRRFLFNILYTYRSPITLSLSSHPPLSKTNGR